MLIAQAPLDHDAVVGSRGRLADASSRIAAEADVLAERSRPDEVHMQLAYSVQSLCFRGTLASAEASLAKG